MNSVAEIKKIYKNARFFGVTLELLDCSIWSRPLWIKFKTFRENIKYAGLVDNYVGNKGQHANKKPKILKMLGCGGGGVAGTRRKRQEQSKGADRLYEPAFISSGNIFLTTILALQVCLLTYTKQN